MVWQCCTHSLRARGAGCFWVSMKRCGYLSWVIGAKIRQWRWLRDTNTNYGRKRLTLTDKFEIVFGALIGFEAKISIYIHTLHQNSPKKNPREENYFYWKATDMVHFRIFLAVNMKSFILDIQLSGISKILPTQPQMHSAFTLRMYDPFLFYSIQLVFLHNTSFHIIQIIIIYICTIVTNASIASELSNWSCRTNDTRTIRWTISDLSDHHSVNVVAVSWNLIA